jgi:hypothetical protein
MVAMLSQSQLFATERLAQKSSNTKDAEDTHRCVSIEQLTDSKGQEIPEIFVLNNIYGNYRSPFEATEKQYGHLYIGKQNALHSLVYRYEKGKNLTEAEATLKRVMRMEEREYGPTHMRIVYDLHELAKIYKLQGNETEMKRVNERLSSLPQSGVQASEDMDTFYAPNSDQPKVATLKMDEDTILHPILKTWVGHGLEGQIPDKSVYRKLNGYKSRDVLPCDWAEYFAPAEGDAARQFCKEISGASKAEVKQLAGSPSYKGGSVPCWHLPPGDEVWVYRFGGTNQMVRVIFRNNRCREAQLCSGKQRAEFNAWRGAKL